ncbi:MULTISPECIES: hypothetical protein [unclassified Clostridium]|uniref:hypothetical protein n=1 Tax=unclassified Clostridium TaxID=2614128 RepID=UPI0025BF4256|nr:MULTISPECIES: hypothetical protein [unclassified Clostridium]
MSIIKKFSKTKKEVRNSDYNDNPQNRETNKVNELMLKGFKKNKEKWRELCSYFRFYPDKFIDFISQPDAKVSLYFYQRIYLRIMMRYRKVFITATRGTSKSYLQNLSFILKCIFYPRTKLFVTCVGKEQAAKISQDCIDDIFEHYPLLKEEVKTFIRSKDYTKLIFHNGSRYDVVQMRDSTRGGRRYGGAIEEICDKKFDGDMLNSVVIPLMANDRTAMCGKVDPNENHKSELYITTASNQQHFAYQKMQEVYAEQLQGKSAFCIGNSYELPCMFGQLDIDFVEDLKESPTYAISDFMREYESIYTGSNSDNLVSEDKLNKSRIVKCAEWEHCNDDNVEYVLAYDVAREEGNANALSALIVIKLTPKDDGTYIKEIVNVFSMEGTHDTIQAKFLKQKVNEFKAKILVIDANGLGSGVCDQLVLRLDDGNPSYSVVNRSEYDKYKQPDSIPMVFALKSQEKETKNTDIINRFMTMMNRNDVGFLVNPNVGLKELEKRYKKKIKDSEEIAELQIPYILTSNMIDQVMNLRYKQQGNVTQVERISSRIQKDMYSALSYGLFWVYLEERKNVERKFKSNFDPRRAIKFRKPKTHY